MAHLGHESPLMADTVDKVFRGVRRANGRLRPDAWWRWNLSVHVPHSVEVRASVDTPERVTPADTKARPSNRGPTASSKEGDTKLIFKTNLRRAPGAGRGTLSRAAAFPGL